MERNPGVKIRRAFSATYCTPAVHTNPSHLVQVLWNLQIWNIPDNHSKPFQRIAMLLSPCHLTLLQNCWSLKGCLIWGPINTPTFTFSKVSLWNFPHKYVNAGPFTPKAFTKFFISPNLLYSGRGKTLLGLVKVLCITFFIPGVNDCIHIDTLIYWYICAFVGTNSKYQSIKTPGLYVKNFILA